jgi:V8-like Glu-specific endopeptidase
MNSSDFKQFSVGAIGIAGCILATGAGAGVSQEGELTKFTAPAVSAASGAAIDYKNAKAMPLPLANIPASSSASLGAAAIAYPGAAGSVSGQPGSGQLNPKVLVPESALLNSLGDDIIPQEYGTSNHAFTTSRVDVPKYNVSDAYPYAPAGKLFFNIGTSTFVCSASLIRRGVIVTAAHCVANYGARQFYSNWRFVPAYRSGVAPYGSWTGRTAWVLSSYFNGTDSCAVRGIVCRNDVAVITLNPQSGAYPGTRTGTYGYGVNGYGFTPTKIAQITQLGYPVSHDGGNREQRTESYGTPNASLSSNTIIGSRQTGGSSGGPWLVNLGVPATLSGTGYGSAATFNIVVGTTSWGYTNPAIKEMGASPFLSTNIVPLVNAACTGFTGC